MFGLYLKLIELNTLNENQAQKQKVHYNYGSCAHMMLVDDFDNLNQEYRHFISNLNNNNYNYTTSYKHSLGNLKPCIKSMSSINISSQERHLLKWIIFLRDPVEHQMSRFYFWRVRHLDEYKKYSLIDNMTFDQCVSKLDGQFIIQCLIQLVVHRIEV